MNIIGLQTNRKRCILSTLIVCLLCLQGCSDNHKQTSPDVLTMKETAEGKTPITVLVKYSFTINAFEKAVEEKFPDIDLIQVGNYTANPALSKEYEARLANDDLTDIVMTWPLEVGEQYWEDRLIDLSGMSFTNSYNHSMLDSIARDGKLYYLPGPAEIRGLVYNKTLFEEKGWQIPNSYEEFLQLCKTIQESGIRSLQLSLANAEVLNTAFVGFNYADAYSKPEDTKWLYEYNHQKKGNFIDHFQSALQTFQELIDVGILQEGDLSLRYRYTQNNLFARETAMVEDSVLLPKRVREFSATNNDEFAIMPFFNKGEDADWARLYMSCYIGLNRHLLEKENKAKYDKVLQLMEYISTPEGQAALSGDNSAMYSSLKGVEPPQVKEIEPLLPALSQGRFAVFPTLKDGETALREGLAAMVAGKITGSEVAALVDDANSNQDQQTAAEVLGKANAAFSLADTGAYICDVMREEADTELALFLDNGKDGLYNAKGVSAKFYQGELTQEDITRVFPALQHGEKGELWKVNMTGADLLKTLEYAIEVDDKTGWFYYASGLSFTFDPCAEPGKRIQKLTLSNGDKIDPAKQYSVAVMEQSIPEDVMISMEKTGVLIQDIIKTSIQKKKTISPTADGRFKLADENQR